MCHAAVGVGSWCFHMTLLYEMQVGYCVTFYCMSKMLQSQFWDKHLLLINAQLE